MRRAVIMLNSTVGAFYNVILQILWIFRSLYDSIIPGNNTPGEEPKKQQPADESNKRHLIHLITTPNHRNNGRPICYVQVCELLTAEEEILRCACAKGYTNNHPIIIKNHKINQPFTWFDTFSTLTI